MRDGEVCIKIGEKSADADKNYGIDLIPTKDTVFQMQANDALVVVAEDDR